MNIASDHPKPLVSARIAEASEMPRNVKSLVKLARENEWDTFVTYARGTTPGLKPHVVELVTLRMRRAGDPTLIGMWIDSAFDTGFSSAADRLNFAGLKERVKAL